MEFVQQTDEEKRISGLQNAAARGAMVREWLKHPGYAVVMKDEIEHIKKALMEQWLITSDESLRDRAKAVVLFEEIVKRIIMTGDNAQRQLEHPQGSDNLEQ